MSENSAVKFLSSDGIEFPISRDAIRHSATLSTLLQNSETNGQVGPITVGNVSSEFFPKIVEYLEHHRKDEIFVPREHDEESRDISSWDVRFLNLDNDTLFKLATVAHNLRIVSLVSIVCQAIANLSKGKTVEEIRIIYGITNDFTPEEEELIRRENAWADEY